MHDVAPTEEVDDGPKTTTFSFMDNEVEEDEAVSTHPTVLPPKKTVKQSDGDRTSQSRIGGASSIKRLVENIAANKGIGAGESRFANLYRESVGAQNTESDGPENADNTGSVGSKFGALIDSMRNGAVSTKQSAAPIVDESSTQSMTQSDTQKDSESKEDLHRWKGFSETLMGSEHIERDEEGDDLLSDLFGDKHAAPSLSAGKDEDSPNQAVSSRASKLMDAIPGLMDSLKDDEEPQKEDSHSTESVTADGDDDEMRWPWQQEMEQQ